MLTVAERVPDRRVTPHPRWLMPAYLILVPTIASFVAWVGLNTWCSVGGCPAGWWLQLRGYLQPAPITVSGVTLLVVWYGAVVVLATIGWRLGVGAKANPVIVERTTLASFERRYFFLVLGVAAIGVAYSYQQIAGATSIVESLTTQSGNSFTEALPDSAGIITLRYATVLAAPIGVYLWRKKVISVFWAIPAVGLLLLNSLIASRLSLLMALTVYVVLWTVGRARARAEGREVKAVRPGAVVVAVVVLLGLLTVMNYVRNGNYYEAAGVSNPVEMNAYQMGGYLAVPAQVSLGVSDAIMRGSFHNAGDVVGSAAAALPSFLVVPRMSKSERNADTYDFSVSFATNFTTNSEFADQYSDFGAWGLLYTLALFPLAGYLFGRFLNYGPIVAGTGGVIAYCFAEVWRIQLLTQGIVVFLILLSLCCAFVAGSGVNRWRPQRLRKGVGSNG